MQKRPVLLTFFFLAILPSFLAFDCTSVSTSSLCGQLSGCTWSGTCSGPMGLTCSIPTCYYIDPIGGSDSGDGSTSAPYKTLTPGFTQLAASTGSLIVFNNAADIEVQILSFVTINSQVTVK